MPNGDQQARPRRSSITNNTGKTLFNPIFIKGGEYMEVAAGGNANEFCAGANFDSSMQYSNLAQGVVTTMSIEKMSGRFNRDGVSHHDADRALAVANYFESSYGENSTRPASSWHRVTERRCR